jgi:hypothetical protein
MILNLKTKQSEDKILQFVKTSSRPFFTNSILNWQYSNDQSDLLFIEQKASIKGTQGMIFHELYDWEKLITYKSFKSETTFVSDELRGTGAFENLYQSAIDYTKNQEAIFIWGFTALSKVWRNKLNFNVNEKIIHEAYLDLKIKSGRNSLTLFKSIFTSLKVKVRILLFKKRNDLDFCEHSNLVRDLPLLQKNISARNKFIELDLTEEFCEWRMKKNPLLKYTMLSFSGDNGSVQGYVIFNLLDKTLRISDYNSVSSIESADVLHELVKIANKYGCNQLSFFANLNNSINKSLFSAFQDFGGSVKINKNMNFVLKSFLNDTDTEINEFSSWRINGLWTEGFTF